MDPSFRCADDDAARCGPGRRYALPVTPLRAGPSRVVPRPVAGLKGAERLFANRQQETTGVVPDSSIPTVTKTAYQSPPGRARSKPKKPPRAERRTMFGIRGDHACVLSHFCTQGCGRTMRPAFRAPSLLRETLESEIGNTAPPRRKQQGRWRVSGQWRGFSFARMAQAPRARAPQNNRGDGACLTLMVVPANAGTHSLHAHWDLLQESQSHFCCPPIYCCGVWVPAFAGTTPNVELASAPRNDDRGEAPQTTGDEAWQMREELIKMAVRFRPSRTA